MSDTVYLPPHILPGGLSICLKCHRRISDPDNHSCGTIKCGCRFCPGHELDKYGRPIESPASPSHAGE